MQLQDVSSLATLLATVNLGFFVFKSIRSPAEDVALKEIQSTKNAVSDLRAWAEVFLDSPREGEVVFPTQSARALVVKSLEMGERAGSIYVSFMRINDRAWKVSRWLGTLSILMGAWFFYAVLYCTIHPRLPISRTELEVWTVIGLMPVISYVSANVALAVNYMGRYQAARRLWEEATLARPRDPDGNIGMENAMMRLRRQSGR